MTNERFMGIVSLGLEQFCTKVLGLPTLSLDRFAESLVVSDIIKTGHLYDVNMSNQAGRMFRFRLFTNADPMLLNVFHIPTGFDKTYKIKNGKLI